MSVKIKIETRQYDDAGNMDTIEFKTSGKLFEKNGNTYIIYKEKQDGEEITNTIKISDEYVSMKRMGAFNTDIRIKTGEKYVCRYVIPQGAFLIETNGRKIDIEKDNCGNIRLFMDYDIDIIDMFRGRNKVTVDVKNIK